MKVEALPRVLGDDIRRNDDPRTERNDTDLGGGAAQPASQLGNRLSLPERSTGKITEVRPEEVSFQIAHKQDDEVVARDPGEHDNDEGNGDARRRPLRGAYFCSASQFSMSSISFCWASMTFWAISLAQSLSPCFSSAFAMLMAA